MAVLRAGLYPNTYIVLSPDGKGVGEGPKLVRRLCDVLEGGGDRGRRQVQWDSPSKPKNCAKLQHFCMARVSRLLAICSLTIPNRAIRTKPANFQTLPFFRRALTCQRVERGGGILRSLKYLENRDHFCYLQYVPQVRIQIGEFDPSADFLSRGVQADQNAEAAAIDIGQPAEIKHDVLVFVQQVPNQMTQVS